MALYELRTYTLHVGKMAEAVRLYQELGFPALAKGHDSKLVGYFQADTGVINQVVHLWRFEDDADRRAHWAAVFANTDFVEGFASRFRPLVVSQRSSCSTRRRGCRTRSGPRRPRHSVRRDGARLATAARPGVPVPRRSAHSHFHPPCLIAVRYPRGMLLGYRGCHGANSYLTDSVLLAL